MQWLSTLLVCPLENQALFLISLILGWKAFFSHILEPHFLSEEAHICCISELCFVTSGNKAKLTGGQVPSGHQAVTTGHNMHFAVCPRPALLPWNVVYCSLAQCCVMYCSIWLFSVAYPGIETARVVTTVLVWLWLAVLSRGVRGTLACADHHGDQGDALNKI